MCASPIERQLLQLPTDFLLCLLIVGYEVNDCVRVITGAAIRRVDLVFPGGELGVVDFLARDRPRPMRRHPESAGRRTCEKQKRRLRCRDRSAVDRKTAVVYIAPRRKVLAGRLSVLDPFRSNLAMKQLVFYPKSGPVLLTHDPRHRCLWPGLEATSPADLS